MILEGPVTPARLAAAEQLAAAGVDSPEYDAAELLAYVLETQRGLLPLADDLTEAQAQCYADLVHRRASKEPLQHLLGTAGFYRLDIQVGSGVFIPRPETELLVEHALTAISGVVEPTVIDLCAGSGAIGLAIAVARVDAHVTAVEQSPEALGWLMRNVEQLAPQVTVVQADVLEPLPGCALTGGVDLVTCNPPYVPSTTAVQHEVDAHDPHVAVFGGTDGLALIRPLVARIAALLDPGGVVLIEHDESHQPEVLQLFTATGDYTDVEGLPDLTGRPRFIRAVRR